MKSANPGINVTLLGKQFMVACPDEERQSLTAAAQMLDQRMREIQKSGRVIGTERCAIMAALNMANELLELQSGGMSSMASERLRSIQEKIELALHQ
ncbi:MAG: cell division protein ZapA [Gammaproteobacteria bacterium]|nr:cell division protein ZapA [Gammaproteobacteria bacterium]